ncbi:MAG: nitroreductase family protein [Candidatus Aminicenantes bacterium]|nr:nitroreductase family protein [Candidatus Aminicenantes bacterium]
MDVTQAIHKRRAYRSLKSVNITKKVIKDLAEHARLSCSCFNNQPWRFVFVYEPGPLKNLHAALSKGNEWAKSASMIIAAFSKKEDDCMIRDREYHQFDLGISVGFLILRATELGLVAHPIAGFSPKKTREILGIPGEYQVITLIIVGSRSEDINPVLSEKQKKAEKKRPPRKSLEKFVNYNMYLR